MAKTVPTLPKAGLVTACDNPELFGIELTPRQRELLAEVESGNLLHVWAMGRRSGKTLLGAIIALWFSLFRDDLAAYVRRRERRYSIAVATNLRQARLFVQAARSIVEASPLLSGLVESTTDDEIAFRNRTTLLSMPCTSRGSRGWAVMTLLMDECAHMLDTEGNHAAEPVYRSLAPSVAQFGNQARVIVASSPFGVDGFFHDIYRLVEKGDLPDATFAHATTMEARPGFESAALELELRRDPEGFRAEYMAEFVAAGGAFLDPARVQEAVRRGRELPPGKAISCIGGADLAFEQDSSALTIVGRDREQPDRLQLVLARSWSPSPGQPLSFNAVLDEIADTCIAHGVNEVYMDQHHAAASREHLQRRGLSPTIVNTTPDSKTAMFRDLKQRIYEGTIELYEQADLLEELRRVETVTRPGAAVVRIPRLGSSHGDIATALALACTRLRANSTVKVLSPNRWRLPEPVEQVAARIGVRAYDPGAWVSPGSYAETLVRRGRR